jgi:SAM-dependent methyltransferase
MFAKSAAIYDAIHAVRFDAAAAANAVHALIQAHKQTSGNALLDVACGTGTYLAQLRSHYAVEGLDLDPGMLAVARQKLPDVPLHHADLVDFDLDRRFDAVLCLGSSIGYVETVDRLRQAVATLARHTLPGGVVIVEPWFGPEVWEQGRLTADLVDQPMLKIARVLMSGQDGRVSTLDIHYLVARPQEVDQFTEHHRLGLFTRKEHMTAFQVADLHVSPSRPSSGAHDSANRLISLSRRLAGSRLRHGLCVTVSWVVPSMRTFLLAAAHAAIAPEHEVPTRLSRIDRSRKDARSPRQQHIDRR